MTGSAFLLIDVGSYGFKEWVAIVASLVGIGGTIFGVWRGWRYSKSQIAARLIEYLHDEEEKIKASRDRIIRHLRWGKPLDDDLEHEFYREMKAANAEQGTERKLDDLAKGLVEDIEVGQKFVSNANLQLATVHLLRGKGALARSEYTVARTAWDKALRCYSQDAEAARYLGELALAEGDVESALEYFSRAYALAPDDKVLKAETWQLIATHYQLEGRPKLELGALVQCAPNFSEAQMHAHAAAAYSRAGELAAQLNRVRQAPELLREAFENYSLCSGRDGMRATRQKLEDLGEDVSDLPQVDQVRGRHIRWPWIRLAAELAILAAAAATFYFSLK
jgi:tetratricopeptide (TPR) repeat protein